MINGLKRINRFKFKVFNKDPSSFWMAFILICFSLWELRIEIKLLIENFTLVGFFYAIYNHPLPFIVLFMIPRLFKD